jgi:hypothetical protein
VIPRNWTTTPYTETIEGVEYRNVWLKNDPQAKRDADMLGESMARSGRGTLPPGYWSKDLAVVAYDGSDLCAIAAGDVRFSQRVRCTMAFLRIFIVPETRHRGIALPLSMKFHEVMRRYSEDNPDLRIGGTMARITVKGIWDEAIGKAAMILIGYTPRNEPLVVRWFEGFKL